VCLTQILLNQKYETCIMRITISGTAGSGKGTVAKLISQKYGLVSYDVGNMRRVEADRRGMSIAEFNKWSSQNPEGDTFFDEKQKALGANEDDFVIVGRLSWFFIPHSLKIYLKVAVDEAGRRIFKHIVRQGRVGEKYSSEQDAIDWVNERNNSDLTRYNSLYGVNHTDESHYDLVIDSTNLTAEEVFEQISQEIDKLI